MGHYTTDNSSTNQANTLPLSREDIVRYQEDLSNYIAKFNIEKREAEHLLTEARNAQDAYRNVIKDQDAKIAELTILVVSLANKVEKISGQ